MKKIVFLLFLPLLFSAGCARHYYRLEDKTLEIYLQAHKAHSVLFASSLDGYQPHPAAKTDEKTWVVHVPAGKEFSYIYIVDGSVHVPECRYRESDEFGFENCIYVPGM